MKHKDKGAAHPGRVAIEAVVLVLVGFWVYWPSLHGAWLWDDELLVTRNALLHSPAGLATIWLGASGTDYWPLTSTLLWIEWHLFGTATMGYHVISLALHLAGGLLVWRLLQRLGLRWGWFGGLLFVVHPLAVESVAWISEIKNTLSLPLFLLSLLAWLDYAEQGKKSRYRLSVLFFLAAMLAKSSVIMLPVVLLLLVWWRRARVTRRDLTDLVPYALIALALGLVTMAFQHRFGGQEAVALGVLPRFALAGAVIFFYLGKFVAPINLLPIYPAWTADAPPWYHYLASPLLALALGSIWMLRRDNVRLARAVGLAFLHRAEWSRHLLLGLGFFLITLAPVTGILPMAYHQISWVGDHLVYLPMIGLVGLVAAGFELTARRLHARLDPPLFGAAALLLAVLAWQSNAYASKFRDGLTLWTYALDLNPASAIVHNNLGRCLADNQRLAEAQFEFETALHLRPNYALAHYNLGEIDLRQDRMENAVGEFREAIRDDPGFTEARNNLGSALQHEGQLNEAADEFEKVFELEPGYAIAHDNLGAIRQKQGQLDDAIDQYRQAVRADPEFARAWFDLANALQLQRDFPGAVDAYRQVLLINPGHVEAMNNLGCALIESGQPGEAVGLFQQVLQARPDDATVQRNLSRAEALSKAGTP
jgi:tetratricopeptide (TPR) repeat protein